MRGRLTGPLRKRLAYVRRRRKRWGRLLAPPPGHRRQSTRGRRLGPHRLGRRQACAHSRAWSNRCPRGGRSPRRARSRSSPRASPSLKRPTLGLSRSNTPDSLPPVISGITILRLRSGITRRCDPERHERPARRSSVARARPCRRPLSPAQYAHMPAFPGRVLRPAHPPSGSKTPPS